MKTSPTQATLQACRKTQNCILWEHYVDTFPNTVFGVPLETIFDALGVQNHISRGVDDLNHLRTADAIPIEEVESDPSELPQFEVEIEVDFCGSEPVCSYSLYAVRLLKSSSLRGRILRDLGVGVCEG